MSFTGLGQGQKPKGHTGPGQRKKEEGYWAALKPVILVGSGPLVLGPFFLLVSACAQLNEKHFYLQNIKLLYMHISPDTHLHY